MKEKLKASPSIWLLLLVVGSFALLGRVKCFSSFPFLSLARRSAPTLSRSKLCLKNSKTSSGFNNEAAPPAYGLYEVQEELLVKRGEIEEKLMAKAAQAPLTATKSRGVGTTGGFGKSAASASSKANFKAEAKANAKILRKEGVVRIDNVLPSHVADAMREYVMDLRSRAQEEVAAGKVKSLDRFADVLLKVNRCDLKMPLGPDPVNQALLSVLCDSPVRATIEAILGPDAVLYELSCLISDPGSQRQVVHPDNPFLQREGKDEPTLLTCFMALQDIDATMGPTTWIPRTHTQAAHDQFKDENVGDNGGESKKDLLLQTKPSVLGTLSKGSCALYDSRVLHCGGANRSDEKRALFYFSFKNPKIGYPGNPASIGYRLGSAKLTISDLSDGIKALAQGKQDACLDPLVQNP